MISYPYYAKATKGRPLSVIRRTLLGCGTRISRTYWAVSRAMASRRGGNVGLPVERGDKATTWNQDLTRVLIVAAVLNVASAWAAGKKHVPTEKDWNPPANEALMAKIAALPDNTWMKLPPHKTSGDIGWCNVDYRRDGPRIRDYCNRMVWAPERERAVYAGAGHNIHPYNDVWEYDLAANTWICLFPREWAFSGLGRKTETAVAVEKLKSRIMLKNGVITTVRGAPVRPAHTWWGIAYDSHKQRMVFWDAHKGLLFTRKDWMAKALGLDPKDPILRGSGSGGGEAWVFTFYPETRKWGEVLTKAPKAYESSQLEYIPDQKALWLRSGRTYMLPEGKTNGWVTTVKKGGPRSGAQTAYDPESKTIVAVVGGKTHAYSTVSKQDATDSGLAGRQGNDA